MRENTNNLLGASMWEGWVWGYLVATIMFLFFEKRRTTQENTRSNYKIGSLDWISLVMFPKCQLSLCEYITLSGTILWTNKGKIFLTTTTKVPMKKVKDKI
jgi:hypothetical protein